MVNNINENNRNYIVILQSYSSLTYWMSWTCKELGDELWVIVNNDEQARAKTGKQEVFKMKILEWESFELSKE